MSGNVSDNEAITKRNATTSLFLKLPSELRIIIYTYVFTGCYKVTKVTKRRHDLPKAQLLKGNASTGSEHLKDHKRPEHAPLALLETCRQIHYETKFLPFTIGTLVISNNNTMVAALASLPSAAFALVKSLDIHFNPAQMAIEYVDSPRGWYKSYTPQLCKRQGLQVMKKLSGLKKVHVFFQYEKNYMLANGYLRYDMWEMDADWMKDLERTVRENEIHTMSSVDFQVTYVGIV